MSTFESVTIATLTAAPIVGVVADRINFATAPKDRSSSFIVLRRTGTTPTTSTDNGEMFSHELDNIRLEVACYAKTLAAANQMARVCRQLLEAARPTTYILQDTLHDYSDLPDMFQVILDFSCWHQDQIQP